MIRFEINGYIYRPLRQVYHFVTTPENDFQWKYETLTCARLTKREMRPGTLFRAVGYFMGQRVESVFEVTGFELNKIYAYKTLSGPTFSNTLYTFEIAGGKTEIRMSVQIHPADLLTSSMHIAEKKLKKQYRENLSLLKDLLEARQVERITPSPDHG
jgi:hypothetical protein